jgi:hypothetical protein
VYNTQVEDFSCDIDVKDASLLPEGILIVWKWNFGYESGDEEDDDEEKDQSSDEMERKNSYQDAQPSHTLIFKCIGTTREKQYQETLRIISNLKPVEQVEVKLQPEPHNPVDSKAIAFVATVENKQYRIGYAVREVLDELHQVISEQNILNINFAWVKYLVEWPRSGPGYYCGISITKRGEWSANAMKFHSTRQR